MPHVAAMKATWLGLKRAPRSLLAASGVGWALLAGPGAAPMLPSICGSKAGGAADLALTLALAPSALILHWMSMILAMTPLLLTGASRHVLRRSFAHRRSRALALFFLGYALVWLAAAIPLVIALLAFGDVARWTGLPLLAVAGLVALAWQVTPLKRRCLAGCHGRPPLAAFGRAADADALVFGAGTGLSCIGTCWALMLLPFAARGAAHWSLMGLVVLVSLVERARVPGNPLWSSRRVSRPPMVSALRDERNGPSRPSRSCAARQPAAPRCGR